MYGGGATEKVLRHVLLRAGYTTCLACLAILSHLPIGKWLRTANYDTSDSNTFLINTIRVRLPNDF